MKLYFYFLEKEYNKSPKMNVEECKVQEKAKSYKLLGKISNYYGTRILKSEIGVLKVEFSWKMVLIIDKPDLEKAKQIFSDYLNNEIKELKEKLKAVENFGKELKTSENS